MTSEVTLPHSSLPLEALIAGWFLLACNFGALLFLSSTGEIMNPKIPIWPSMAKDFSWLVLMAVAIRAGTYSLQRQLPIIAWVAAALLVLSIILYAGRRGMDVDLNFVKSIKNAALYMWAPLLLASFANLRYRIFVGYLIGVLFTTLLVSVTIYFLAENAYKAIPPDLRMFGSTGNPNTASLFSLLLFSLVTLYFEKMKPRQRWICFLVAFLSSYLSASLFYLLMMMAVSAYFSALALRQHQPNRLRCYWIEILVTAIVACALAIWLTSLASYPGVPIALRLESAQLMATQSALYASDSVAIRMRDLSSMHFSWIGSGGDFRQFDSTFFTFIHNFGLPGALFVLCPFLSVLWLRHASWCLDNIAIHVLIICFSIIFFGGLAHYQISHFPSNVVLYTLLAFSLKESLKKVAFIEPKRVPPCPL